MAALLSDRIVVSTLVFILLLALPYAVPLLEPDTMALIGDSTAFVVLSILVILACGRGVSRLGHTEERRFWMYILAAFSFWLAVDVTYLLFPAIRPTAFFQILGDYLYVCYYAAVVLATEEAPHLHSDWSLGESGYRFGVIGTVLLALTLLTYFAFVPIIYNSDVYTTTLPSFYLYVACDLFVVMRLTYLFFMCSGPRWKTLYGMLLLSFLVSTLSDLLDTISRAGLFPIESGTWWDFIWYSSFVILILAIRARHLPLATTDAPRGLSDEIPRRLHSPLYAYAVAIPGLHFGLYGAGLLDEASRPAREVVVLLAVVALGGVATVHQRRLEGSLRQLRAEVTVKSRQLLQSQKMEAIGRLAGGIAHDFNNLLTVMLGHAEAMSRELPEGSTLMKRADEIRKASKRAGSLTAQLLAFSRQQILHPKVVDLNALLHELLPMLERLIGEDVTIETHLQKDLANVMADPTQIEQVIVNVFANARDAMPSGGKMTIMTANLAIDDTNMDHSTVIRRGRYVALSIRDTGVGMSEEVRKRIFEPFFTTKELGRGAGLGLSTAYGIITQSGGHILCESKPGRGTVFRILLPRSDGDLAEEQPSGRAVEAPAPSAAPHPERILVVEDEAGVRELMGEVLRQAGYEVETAENGQRGMDVWLRSRDGFDLIVTDVVMPGIGGFELMRELRKRDPGLKVAFVSGYAHQPDEAQAAALNAPFLAKPFTSDEFLTMVRGVLASPGRSRPHA